MKLGRSILGYLIAIVVLAPLPYLFANPFLTHIGVLIGVYATLALSMNLMMRIGQLSFAHGAFFGLGAYGSALLMMRLGFPFVLAFVCSAVLVTLLAWIVGQMFLRIKGVYFVLLTFAFGEMIVLVFIEWVSLFGGSNGLVGVPRPSLFGVEMQSREAFYLFALAIALFAYATVSALYRSDLGAVITSLDENEPLTHSLGINPRQYRLLTFCFSSFLAAIAGSVYGHYMSIITPEDYGFSVPVNLVVMNVMGGMAHPLGAMLGALLLVPLPEFLRDAKQYQMLSFGIVLIVFLRFLPDGLFTKIRALWRAKKGSPA